MIEKREFIWNIIASTCAAALSMVLLFVVTRVNGVTEAGMFSIAFATATVLNAIADYGMRVYQVTDTERKHRFGVYLSSRYCVDFLMVIIAIIFVLINHYDATKAIVCLGLVAFRSVDGISETYQGEFQLNGRLDIASKSVTYRMVISVLLFTIVDVVTKNIVYATLVLFVTNFVLLVFYDFRKIKQYTKERIIIDPREIKIILLDCFPIFCSTMLNNYIVNAPKYAIDRFLTYDMQTYFNIIYLPTFTINLMSIFVLKPMLKTLGEMWNTHENKRFISVIAKMGMAIVMLTILVEVVCFAIGIPVLNLIYNVDISRYKSDLMILVIAGGLSALSVAIFYALTTMRRQSRAMIGYTLAALCGMFLPNYMVSNYEMRGAVLSCVAIMLVQTGALFAMFIVSWKQNIERE